MNNKRELVELIERALIQYSTSKKFRKLITKKYLKQKLNINSLIRLLNMEWRVDNLSDEELYVLSDALLSILKNNEDWKELNLTSYFNDDIISGIKER